MNECTYVYMYVYTDIYTYIYYKRVCVYMRIYTRLCTLGRYTRMWAINDRWNTYLIHN